MNTILNKLVASVVWYFVAFVFGFIAGYHIKSNAVNSANAKQEIKLASLQARYDEVSALTAGDYLTAFNGVLHQYESSNINSNVNQHDILWHLFVKHIAGEVAKNKPTCRVDETTTTRLENGKLNSVQLEFLQSYIRQIEELQK